MHVHVVRAGVLDERLGQLPGDVGAAARVRVEGDHDGPGGGRGGGVDVRSRDRVYPSTWIVQHTRPCPGLMRSSAVPLPSGSPWFGTPCALTSFAPVRSSVNGRPPVAADAGAAQMTNKPTDATSRPVMRRPDDIATPKEATRTISADTAGFKHRRLPSDRLASACHRCAANSKFSQGSCRPTQFALLDPPAGPPGARPRGRPRPGER